MTIKKWLFSLAGATVLLAQVGVVKADQLQDIATGNLAVAAISRQNPAKAPVSKFMLKDSPCYIGLKKNEPTLQAKVDELIVQALKDNALNTLSQKWMQAPLPADLGA